MLLACAGCLLQQIRQLRGMLPEELNNACWAKSREIPRAVAEDVQAHEARMAALHRFFKVLRAPAVIGTTADGV